MQINPCQKENITHCASCAMVPELLEKIDKLELRQIELENPRINMELVILARKEANI